MYFLNSDHCVLSDARNESIKNNKMKLSIPCFKRVPKAQLQHWIVIAVKYEFLVRRYEILQ